MTWIILPLENKLTCHVWNILLKIIVMLVIKQIHSTQGIRSYLTFPNVSYPGVEDFLRYDELFLTGNEKYRHRQNLCM